MKKLVTLLMMLALLLPTTGTALAGVDWDGDPMFRVSGRNVRLAFSVDYGDFVRAGGHIHVSATGQDIRLLGKGPRWFSAEVHEGGDVKTITLTTTLQGNNAPSTVWLRVKISGTRYVMEQEVAVGVAYTFALPQ